MPAQPLRRQHSASDDKWSSAPRRGTTTAHTRSPACGSGTPMTATSATPGWAANTSSISNDEIFGLADDRVLIRPVTTTSPSVSNVHGLQRNHRPRRRVSIQRRIDVAEEHCRPLKPVPHLRPWHFLLLSSTTRTETPGTGRPRCGRARRGRRQVGGVATGNSVRPKAFAMPATESTWRTWRPSSAVMGGSHDHDAADRGTAARRRAPAARP